VRLANKLRHLIAAGCVAFSLTLGAALGAETTNVSLRWFSLPNASVAVHGLPWYAENNGALTRLPLRSKESFRPAVWSLAQSPSGGRIRFRTDTRVLALRLAFPSPPNMANMHAYGQTGVDVYADGVYISTAIADKAARASNVLEHVSFDFVDKPRTEREITLYLPLYKPVKVCGIGVDKDAKVSLPKPFALPKPVVFYGTSITQGGCASRPGMSYPAILGRMLNVDFVNLGFSGNGLGEPEVARAVAEIDAACFVLDFGANHKTFDDMERAYAPFLETLREKHPHAPILALTPIYTVREIRFESLGRDWSKRREHIREVVNRRVAAGDNHLHLVEGTDLLGPSRADGLVDGGHPNDLGFHWMAEGLAPSLRKLLGLP
jgi:lysophospholipase L1-like esterase